MTNIVTQNRRHFEDIAEGEVIALGPQKITKQMITDFAIEFDPLPFHLDESAAKASLLGGLAASGYQTSGLSLRMLVDQFLNHVASEGGLNFTQLKWRKPLFVNDALSGTATITSLRLLKSRPQWGAITLDFHMHNQKGETVMTMTLENLVAVRNVKSEAIA